MRLYMCRNRTVQLMKALKKNLLAPPIPTRWCIFFLRAHNLGTPRLSVHDLEQLWNVLPPKKFSYLARKSVWVRTKHVKKTRVSLWRQSSILEGMSHFHSQCETKHVVDVFESPYETSESFLFKFTNRDSKSWYGWFFFFSF